MANSWIPSTGPLTAGWVSKLSHRHTVEYTIYFREQIKYNHILGENICRWYEWQEVNIQHIRASRVVLAVKNSPAHAGNARDVGSIPGLGRSPGEGNGSPLQYSCLENPIDGYSLRGSQSWTQLSNWAHTRPTYMNSSHVKQTHGPIKKWVEEPKRCFSKEEMHMRKSAWEDVQHR